MARTRSRGAHQAGLRITEQDHQTSSSDDSTTEVGGKTRRRPDGFGTTTVPTLRPSREERANVSLASKKRDAAAAHLNDGPSEAEQRRRKSRFTSNAIRGGSASASDKVNPVALAIMNKPHRNSIEGLRPAQRHGIAVELRRRRAPSGVAWSIPETEMCDEEQAEMRDDQHAPETEMEEPTPARRTTHRPHYTEDIDEDVAGPDAETGSPDMSRRDASDASDVSPRSGESDHPPSETRQEIPSQWIPRKSQTRRPKAVYNERPPVEKSAGSVSKSASTRSRQPPPPSTAKTISTVNHLKDLFRLDEHSPNQNIRADSMFIQDDESSYDETDDALEESYSQEPPQDSLLFQTLCARQSQLTVAVPSNQVRSMCNLMGRKAWTAYNKSWARDISDLTALREQEDLPGTSLGTKCLKIFTLVRKLYRGAPTVRDVARQNSFLLEKSDQTARAIAQIEEYISRICDKLNAHVPGTQSSDARRRKAMERDLIQCIIPFLVLLLREFFFLGGTSINAEGERQLPEKEGAFTSTTLHLLRKTAGWISRLALLIKFETELKGIEASSDEEDGSESPRKKYISLRQKHAEEIARQRLTLHDLVQQFLGTIRKSVDELDENAVKEARLRRRMERAAEVAAEREAEQQRALKENQARWEKMCLSTQRLRDGPGPVSQMWAKALEAEERRRAEWEREQAQRDSLGSPQLGGFFDESPAGPARRARRRSTPVQLEDRSIAKTRDRDPGLTRLWSRADQKYLLMELRKQHRRSSSKSWEEALKNWAASLGRRVDEVRREAELLKISARAIADERGLPYETWSKK